MSRFLIVDDNKKRGPRIKEYLCLKHKVSDSQIDYVDCVKSAEELLSQTFYALAFIDMSLPYNEDDRADPFSGIAILKKIQNKKLKQPIRVIGFTALDENVKEKEDEFENLGFKLYYYPEHDLSWLGKINSQIEYAIESSEKYRAVELDMALVTIHGINTFGNWQENLSAEMRKNNKNLDFSHFPFKSAKISFRTFLNPKKRDAIVMAFKNQLVDWLEKNRSKRIVFFSHSFGTYILMNALTSIENPSLLKNISLIVLSGSVLRRDFDFKRILENSDAIIINECASNDVALLCSEMFSRGTGMAGKLGFNYFAPSRIKNRFHLGNHSSFFEKEFIKNNWFPLVNTPIVIEEKNDAPDINILNSPLTFLAMFIGKLKNSFFK